MPDNIADLVWLLGGAIIVGLLTVIGHFVVRWMSRHDAKADNTASLLAAHDKEIAVLKKDNTHLLEKVDSVLSSLKEHIDREEGFWEKQEERHNIVVNKLISAETRLIRIEERHVFEDKK